MRSIILAAAMLLLAGCPYRTQVYRGDAALWKQNADGTYEMGKRMGLANAQGAEIDLATLAQDCESGVIATIDEIRTIGGLNIFTGSRRGLEVWCAVLQ